jgi:hypothetical protein
MLHVGFGIGSFKIKGNEHEQHLARQMLQQLDFSKRMPLLSGIGYSIHRCLHMLTLALYRIGTVHAA